MTLNLKDGKEVTLIPGADRTIRLLVWADRSGKGIDLSPEEAKELGLSLYWLGRRASKK